MLKRTSKTSFLFGLLLTVAMVACGCGKPNANEGAVSGTVTLDGKPIEEGSILFIPIQGTRGSVAGGQITNGRYQLSDPTRVAVGWNRVQIHAMQKTGKMVPKPFSSDGQLVAEKVEAVPPRYHAQSTLKVEVKPGDNTADFDLSSQ